MEVEKTLKKFNIPFILDNGNPIDVIIKIIRKLNGSILVSDFDPLKIKRKWKEEVAKKIKIPFYEVDAHNVVPCFHVSQKQEFGANTIHPIIHRILPEFLNDFPKLKKMKANNSISTDVNDWKLVYKSLKVDERVKPVNWIKPGEEKARKTLKKFIEDKLDDYDLSQNHPNPFNPNTTINFTIPENGLVILKVYNILGSEVTTLVNQNLSAGSYNYNFESSNLASGIYFYELKAGNFAQIKKMNLLK